MIKELLMVGALGVIFHVAAGSVALASGATALIAKKGGSLHRSSGKVFFWSMLLMAVSGIILAMIPGVLITVLAGCLTLYMICSSYFAAHSSSVFKKRGDIAALTLGMATFIFGAALCARAMAGTTDSFDGYSVPAPIYFIFTAIIAIGVSLDIRILIAKKMSYLARIRRHLWRMSVALYIAASSFFEGQAQVFPEYLQGTIYLSLPGYLALLVMAYWLIKLGFSFDRTGRKTSDNTEL